MIIEVLNQTKETAKDRACLFGDGFFTTGIIFEHQFCHQDRHFKRLIKSAKKLRFEAFELTALSETIGDLCKQNSSAVIRIDISRIQKQRGYAISNNAEYLCKMTLSDDTRVPTQACQLLDAKTAISYNKSLAGIKHLNRLDSVLAASEISNQHQEVLMYHNDQVICGSRTNLFVKLDGVWLTPKLDRCGVEGITRARVLKLFQEESIDYQITDINRADLKRVSAAFVTNSLIGIWSAILLNNQKLNPEDSEYIQKLVSRT